MEASGAGAVKTLGSLRPVAYVGLYFTWKQSERMSTPVYWVNIRVNDGREPEASVTEKESKTRRESMSNLRVSSPVSAVVIVAFWFSNPSTSTLGGRDFDEQAGAWRR